MGKQADNEQDHAEATAEIGNRHGRVANHPSRRIMTLTILDGVSRLVRGDPDSRPRAALCKPHGTQPQHFVWAGVIMVSEIDQGICSILNIVQPGRVEHMAQAAGAPLSGAGLRIASAYAERTRAWAHIARIKAGATKSRYRISKYNIE